MTPASLSDLRTVLREVLEPRQLAGLDGLPAPDSRTLIRELVRKGWLTPYQANQLALGRAGELFLGPYVILDRLGEGGMGAVFKARHRNLGRTVALKRIRKDRLASPDAVRRFLREVRAAAQLNHPNVVLAYDADQIGDDYILVMEYVEGIDLARLVREQGPLPAAKACDVIHQAALGLQHAFERGMVHRDIKPHNLLCSTRDGTVKVLDMGLARVSTTSEEETISVLTREGVVMGSVDFLAPEQARNSHLVDIRADVYSLGCTFYFLLTGRVPFPTGTSVEKMLKHQLDQPEPVEQFRPDVPASVIAILRRMMAKKPADRFQTPGEIADALAGLVGEVPETPAAGGETATDLVASPTEPDAPVREPDRIRRARAFRRSLRRVALACLLICGVATGASFMKRWYQPTPEGPGKQTTPRTTTIPEIQPNRAIFGAHPTAKSVVLALSPEGRQLVTAGTDRTLIVWNLLSKTPERLTERARREFDDARWSADGRWIASAETVTHNVTVLSAGDWTQEWRVPGRIGRNAHVGLSASGDRLAVNHQDESVVVWDPESKEELGIVSGHKGRVQALAFSPQDAHVLAVTAEDRASFDRLSLWEVNGAAKPVTAQAAGHFRTGPIFTEDGTTVLGLIGKKLHRWEALSLRETDSTDVPAISEKGPVVLAANSRRLLASADSDLARGVLCDTATGTPIAFLVGSASPLSALAIAANGWTAAAVCEDGRVLLWDLRALNEP
jgi:serine/threonine-protein kinase